ncbi:MAG TPA: hypothetical protein VH008_22880, partial [Pseudonocardia sp.]|nr:hypothetical protein [Pseudonocardia sp.]
DFLTEYLSAVRQQLARRQVVVHSAAVHPPMPQQALGLSLELSLAGVGAEPAASPGAAPLPAPRERLRAGWHEELGWWAEPVGRPGADRRWFAAELVPPPDRVADYLAGLTRHENLGATAPALHRYRLLAAPDDLLARLDVARRMAAPVKVDATRVGSLG